MALREYREKRDFARSGEPRGTQARKRNRFSFVVQQHAASHLHYDFRLELDGVLLSWAVPKGPSLDPKVKRLAMQTEDHPIDYGEFEGVIAPGNYGAGTVLLWDRGRWVPEGDPRAGYAKGHLRFELQGQKLHGGFHLVRTHARDGNPRAWLLIKSRDAAARSGSQADAIAQPGSVQTGRALDEIAQDADRSWASRPAKRGVAKSSARPRKPAKPRKPSVPSVAAYAGARKAALPRSLEPQLATLVDAPPDGEQWLHELKLDGYRILARRDAKAAVQLLTRRGNDWTERLPKLARAIAELPLGAALLDGELVVMHEGISDFQHLQNSLSAGNDGRCLYYVFDLLYLGEHDLRALPQLERKRLLQATLESVGVLGGHSQGPVRYSDHVVGQGPAFFRRARELGAEGSVCKRVDAPYVSGRGRSWLKVKAHARQELVIGGYTDPEGGRKHLGAILVGSYDEQQRLKYAGKVGTGFTEASLRELHEQLAPLETDASPFDDPPRGFEARGVHWLRPELVAEVEFGQRTREGRVRHASFQGLRQDKSAAQVHDERAQPMPADPPRSRATKRAATKTSTRQRVRASAPRTPPLALSEVHLSNPERVLFPEQGITKAELALYYSQVAQWMLPLLARRPLMLLRCPEGHHSECFFQKHPSRGVSDAIHRVEIHEKARALQYMTIDDAEGLIALVQLGALEIHSWGSRIEHLETPDQLIFDVDPDAGLPWSHVVEAAHSLRSVLTSLELRSFVKTTGGKGLHVVVPVVPRTPWDAAKDFCKALVQKLVRAEPKLYLANMSKAKRAGKIFLDYLRNGRGATAVCAYSTRASAQAPVAMPVAWEQLGKALRSDHFHLHDVPAYLATRERDPWAELLTTRQAITPAMRRALGAR